MNEQEGGMPAAWCRVADEDDGWLQESRASNVHIPAPLMVRVAKARKQYCLSAGELIIAAVEATYPKLIELVRPEVMTGGTLFAARRGRPSRIAEGPLTPLNYRMREEDFVTLDRIVEEAGASSRSRLVTVALTAYLKPKSRR